ncbi:hypothetical protein Scep_002095 [Stephania cephalantha]|uniref:Uncharacterized protein n=1 Tax=Stephania cephalantha TaxID=152367 RepID=A0AAP0LDA4_9MAGN
MSRQTVMVCIQTKSYLPRHMAGCVAGQEVKSCIFIDTPSIVMAVYKEKALNKLEVLWHQKVFACFRFSTSMESQWKIAKNRKNGRNLRMQRIGGEF